MDRKMNVLDVQLDDYTAKEAMKAATEYMKTEPVNTIEIVTVDILMRVAEDTVLKENLEQIDMVLAGDEAILEAAGAVDKKKLQEADSRVFLKMLVRYFHKNHSKIFLLSDTEEELVRIAGYLEQNYNGIEVVGTAAVPEDESADDMITNRINGAESEVDCIIATVTSPKQEAFIQRCKPVLNAKLWLGLGKGMVPSDRNPGLRGRITEFIEKKVLKLEVEKEKKKKTEI